MWTGLLFAMLSLAGITLPYLEVGTQSYSLFQTLRAVGLGPLAWALLAEHLLLVPEALGGHRWYVAAVGMSAAFYMGITVTAVITTVGADLMLRHLGPGIWACCAGTAGLLLTPLLQPVDAALHKTVTSWWAEEGLPPAGRDGP